MKGLRQYITTAFIVGIMLLVPPILPHAENAADHGAFDIVDAQFTKRDKDHDGIYDALVIDLTVQTFCTGHYAFHATLENDNGDIISSRPAYEYASPVQHPGLNFKTNEINQQHSVVIPFSGEEIHRAKVKGPYTLALINMGMLDCTDIIAPYKPITIPTPIFNYKEFGEKCGSGETARPCKDVYK